MKTGLPNITIISAIRARQSARADLRALESQASFYYGELYWETEEFGLSRIARAMEFSTAEVEYYTHKIHQSLNYN